MKLYITIVLLFFYSTVSARSIFVSNKGNDKNPGTFHKPIKSLFKAFAMLNKGVDTIYILKGNYFLDRPIELKRVSGLKNSKILISSYNGPVSLSFSHKVKEHKMLLFNCNNIKINNIGFYGNKSKLINTYDILLSIRFSHFIEVYNCYFRDAYEEGLKVSQCSDIISVNNVFENFNHEGIDYLNVVNGLICNNRISNVGRVGIMVKGGSENILISNNYIKNSKVRMVNSGITIGGATAVTSARDHKKGAFEAYNIYAINNKIISNSSGLIKNGIAFYGAKSSYAINNYIDRSDNGIEFKKNNSRSYGWEEDVNNEDVYLRGNNFNNIELAEIKVSDPIVNLNMNMSKSEQTNLISRNIKLFGDYYKINDILLNCNIQLK